MNLFSNVNIITILIIGIFMMPLLTGIFHPITSNRIQHSFHSILNSIKFIIGIILAINLIRIIFSDKGNGILDLLYKFIPSAEDLIIRYNHDIVAYIIVLFIFQSIILWIMEILTIPLYRFIIIPLADRLSSVIDSMNLHAKRLLSVVWQLPKSICMVLIFSLLLSFYTNYINNPATGEYINKSSAYQIINKNVLLPLLSTDISKQLPVLINDSFKKASEGFTPTNDGDSGSNYWKQTVIKYFNGMTLEEAIKSSSDIDSKAKQIVGTEKNDKEKAYLLYEWIRKNVQYDKAKAAIIVKDSSLVKSGSIVTYAERKGVCFDYSCLYVSMCRAVGLNVRFVTGLGYTGVEWGDHSWNQVYYAEEQRWINVDTTFGSSGYNYFDSSDFSMNHKYDVVQGEW